MSRITDIFLLARDTLNDPNAQRWSDDTLLRNLRLALRDIALATGLFKNIITIPLISGENIYQMPKGVLRLGHVTYRKILLPLKSSGYMDNNYAADWRTHAVELPDGTLIYAIFDEVKRTEIATYPTGFGDFTVFYQNVPNLLGLVGALEYEGVLYPQNSYYGVVNEFVDTELARDIQDTLYGVVTAVEEIEILTIYYTRTPPLPNEITDELVVDECFDLAMKYHICATALMNDVDQQNREFAASQFALYQREIDEIVRLANTDSVSASSFESHYNGTG